MWKLKYTLMISVPPYTVTFLPYFETADILFLSLTFFENLLNEVA